MNYKINNTSVCLDKFTSLVVSFCFEKCLNTLYTGRRFMLDAINLLLENVLNGEYAQRLVDMIYVNDFDFDEPIAMHIRHSKRFPVAG